MFWTRKYSKNVSNYIFFSPIKKKIDKKNSPRTVKSKLVDLICRYSGPLAEGLTDSTNQSITGSYVDFSRDYYTPNIQNTSNFLIQSTLHRGETPTYV